MKQTVLFILVSFLLLVQVFAFGTKETASEEAIEFKASVIKGPSGLGAVYLFESQDTMPNNVSYDIEALASADAMAAKLLSGETDFAILPVNMAAKMYNANVPYKLIAVTGNGMIKFLTSDTSIKSIKDLVNKQVYVAGKGATPEFLLNTILSYNNINPETDIELLFNMPYPEMAANLASGKIKYAVLPEPFATIAKVSNSQIVEPLSISTLWTEASGSDDYPMTVLVCKSSFIEEQPKAVVAFMEAYKNSIIKVVADPKEAGVLAEKNGLGLKAAVAQKAIPQCSFVFLNAEEAKSSVETLLATFLLASPSSIGNKLPSGEWYAKP